MSIHTKQIHDWMMRRFRRADETDAHLKALKEEVRRLMEAAAKETENDQKRARLLAEYKAAVDDLNRYVAKGRG